MKKIMSKLGYKPAPVKTGPGKFGNMGQKKGKPGAVGKEQLTPVHTGKVMQKVLNDMRKGAKRKTALGNYDSLGPGMYR